MRTERVAVRHAGKGLGAGVKLSLREPCGRDELAVAGVDTQSAIDFLDRLLEKPPSGQARFNAIAMPASERDALLAALHRLCWGDRILSSLTCAACARPFDLSFELSDLQRQLQADYRPLNPHWRLPSGEDEMASVAEGTVAEALGHLAVHCGLQEGEEIEALAVALEAAAPILDVDLNAECPECGYCQFAHFDVQSFLLQRILGEREALYEDIHVLARSYGWSLREILGLTRSARRALVQRIVGKGAA